MRDKYLTPAAPAAGFVCRTLRIPNGEEFLAAVNGALLELTYPWNWEQFGALTPDETAELFFTMYEDYRESRGCVLGTVFAHALGTAPLGALSCDGATYLRVDYPALYAVIHGAYKIDADHFKTPDLRGRTVIGNGQGPGLSNRTVNQSIGTETETLSASQMPAHTHGESIAVPAIINGGLEAPASAAVPGSGTTGSAGGGESHNNMQPTLVLRYYIWAQ